MKKIFFIPFLLLAVFNTVIKAQSSLGIDTSNSIIPASVNYNAQYLFIFSIKNYGPQPATGSVNMTLVVDSAGNFNGNFSGLDTANSHMVNLNAIPVNGEQPDSTTITIDNQYRSGINTVVIWPRNNQSAFVTHDTTRIHFLVTGYSGIKNYTETKPIIFPNPMQSRLFIANKDPDFIIEQVRIYDISGQLVYSEKFKGSIDVNKLVSGVYTLEFTDSKGNLSRYKVIKE